MPPPLTEESSSCQKNLYVISQAWPQQLQRLAAGRPHGESCPPRTSLGAWPMLTDYGGRCSQGLMSCWPAMLLYRFAALTQAPSFPGVFLLGLQVKVFSSALTRGREPWRHFSNFESVLDALLLLASISLVPAFRSKTAGAFWGRRELPQQ